MTEFRKKVGDVKLKEANDKFDKVYQWWLDDVSKKDSYKKMSPDDQASLKTKAKAKIKKMIFDANDFKPSKAVNKEKTEETNKLLP